MDIVLEQIPQCTPFIWFNIQKNPRYMRETIVVKQRVLKRLLFLSDMGNVSLNRSVEPVANPKVNLNCPPMTHLPKNAISCCSSCIVVVDFWERVELPWSHFLLSISAFSPIKRSRLNSCRVPQFSANGRIHFPWIRTNSPYSCTIVRSGASITNPTKSLGKQFSQVL